ncbi:MAG: GGDEF domain-containing protein, partial [Terriglobales bacterium]
VFLNQGIADYWTRPFRRLGWHLALVAAATVGIYFLTQTPGHLPWRILLAGGVMAFELGLGAWLFAREGAGPAAWVMAGFALASAASGPAILLSRSVAAQHAVEALTDYSFLFFDVLLAMALVWMIIADLRVRLDQLARTDDLTGLMNRRALEQEGARRMSGAAAIVVDLDHFKQLNDQHGHGAGDHALRQVAELLRASLGDGDLAARLGGEEFLVLIEAANLAKGVERAERLRQGVAAMRLKVEQREVGITASFGVAVAQGPAESWPSLLQRADGALYAAKQAGRNCVCAAPAAAAARAGATS